MTKAINGGIYKGGNPVGKQISLDKRRTKVADAGGTYIDVPSLEYVSQLEKQILELKNTIAIMEGANARKDARLHELIRKIDAKLR